MDRDLVTIEQLVAIRRTARTLDDSTTRRRLLRAARGLRATVPAAMPKRKAAVLLGVAPQVLDRWIARADIPTVRTPRSSRTAVDRDALVRLLEEVEAGRESGLRHPLAAAIAAVGDAPEMRPLRQPNQDASELRREYQNSSGAERMLAAAALQRAAGLFADAGRSARA